MITSGRLVLKVTKKIEFNGRDSKDAKRKGFGFGVYRRISRPGVNQRIKQSSLEIVLVRDLEKIERYHYSSVWLEVQTSVKRMEYNCRKE